MSRTLDDQIIALAGLFQASRLVKQIAWHGIADSEAQCTLIESIFRIDADNVENVYGGLPKITLGLETLRDQLSGEIQAYDTDVTRYAVTLLHLERKLKKRKELLEKILTGISFAREQLNHFPVTHINVLSRLADVYQQTISTLTPRIMINGEHVHLNNPDNAARVRALLLSGIRAAVLWRQCGGSRWKLLFERRKMLIAVQRLLKGQSKLIE